MLLAGVRAEADLLRHKPDIGAAARKSSRTPGGPRRRLGCGPRRRCRSASVKPPTDTEDSICGSFGTRVSTTAIHEVLQLVESHIGLSAVPGVSQQFIELLNLPVARLKDMAAQLEIEFPAESRKWALVDRLSKVPTKDLPELAADWVHAGRTSITYVSLGDGAALEADKVTEALTDMCGVNPLEESIRPSELTPKPTLIAASKSDDRFFLSFGVKKPVARVLSDFTVKEIEGDHFFSAVIRLDPPIVEVRTNHERAERLTTSWIADFDDLLFGDGEENDEEDEAE